MIVIVCTFFVHLAIAAGHKGTATICIIFLQVSVCAIICFFLLRILMVLVLSSIMEWLL
jgi:hypothetical protein